MIKIKVVFSKLRNTWSRGSFSKAEFIENTGIYQKSGLSKAFSGAISWQRCVHFLFRKTVAETTLSTGAYKQDQHILDLQIKYTTDTPPHPSPKASPRLQGSHHEQKVQKGALLSKPVLFSQDFDEPVSPRGGLYKSGITQKLISFSTAKVCFMPKKSNLLMSAPGSGPLFSGFWQVRRASGVSCIKKLH